LKYLITLLFILAFAFSLSAQKLFRGMVVDSSSLTALHHVNITIKGSNRDAFTNASGVFTINASPVDTLVFTFLGYAPVELPLFLEEDALFIRMREQIKMLQEITVKATRLYPNEIINRTKEAPRKMSTYQAFQSPFTYFSKIEKEKRKIYRYIEESNRTQTYVQVITDPVVKEIFTKNYNLSEEEYYALLARFNEHYREISYATDPEDIMEALHSYFEAAR
jgi:hypothetical protein